MGKSNADQSIRYSLHFRFVELLRAPSPPCCPRQSASRPIQPGVYVLSQTGPHESALHFRAPPRTCVLESKKGPDPRSASRSTTILRHLPVSTESPPKAPDNAPALLRSPGCAINFPPADTHRKARKSPSGISTGQMNASAD